MSIKWMSLVWESSPYEGSRLLLHLAMADHANDLGWFYAGQNSLSRKARCSVEYVRQSTQRFVDDGFLLIEKKGSGKGHATEYRLLPIPVTPNTVGPSQPPNRVGVDSPTLTPQLPNSDGQLPNSTPNQPSYTTKNNQDLVSVAPATNSGQIITAWIDGLRVRPPDRVVGQIAREVRLLLEQGFAPAVVLSACHSISAKGLHPSTLASEVNSIVNPPTGNANRGPATADHRISGLAALLTGGSHGTQ